ncbi:hypothetical protein FPL04_17045 [Xanthomonas arboricola]|nr:hypothetical protein FPL04_17045 [Xanthomonas arboricola]
MWCRAWGGSRSGEQTVASSRQMAVGVALKAGVYAWSMPHRASVAPARRCAVVLPVASNPVPALDSGCAAVRL